MISDQDLEALVRQKYSDTTLTGWGPRRRLRFGYFTPDDIYEATVARYVGAGTRWLDVGCGRELFPGNIKLSEHLASHCQRLVGIDVGNNLQDNQIVHEKINIAIEDYVPDSLFELVTMRMVAEHIVQPQAAVAALSRITKLGGKVIVFTVNRFSPVTIASALTPHCLHHPLKALLWKTEQRDTFPAVYLMNTRGQLEKLFKAAGFREYSFERVDDCRTFARFKVLNWLELSVWALLHKVGCNYPEHCLVGIYERIL